MCEARARAVSVPLQEKSEGITVGEDLVRDGDVVLRRAQIGDAAANDRVDLASRWEAGWLPINWIGGKRYNQ